MDKKESKYFKTAQLFDEAFIILLEKKEIDYITVKEICETAGFNRSTFYLHYESINDLLKETLEYTTQKLISYFNRNPKDFIANINNSSKEDLIFINEQYLRPYLQFVKDNKKLFLAVFKNGAVMQIKENYSNLEKYIFNPILDKHNVSNDKRKYMIKFYIKGIMAIVEEWTINDCQDKIEDIMNIIIECVRP